MMRSLYAGISGLRNHQTRMDVVGNNIANVNTVGFKASRVTFQDMLSQTIQGAAGASGNRGGTNPMQIGLGMGLASIDTIFTDGSFQPTGKQTDLAIGGQGFFVLGDGLNQVYTRAGAFDFDTAGNFLVPGTGYKVMGWKADSAGKVDPSQPIQGIQIPVGGGMPAQVSSKLTYAANLSASAKTGSGSAAQTSINVYDSQGNTYKLNGTFEKAADNQWSFRPAGTIIDAAGAVVAKVTTSESIMVDFNANGTFKQSTSGATIKIDPADVAIVPSSPYKGAGAFILNPDFSTMTQFGGDSTAQATVTDGYGAGTLSKVTIDPTGTIVGRFTNGQSLNLAQVALAVFNNPAGLNKVGENLFIQSNNSGVAQVGQSDSGGRGKFSPGSLEMSNVDLASEFSNMIVTQRGFQANSKIITTTDTMLEELVNLKR